MSGPTYTGFQDKVNPQPAPGQAGDYYGVDPRTIAIGGPGEYLAPASGLIVGNFCWVNADTGAVSQSYVPGYQLAFLHRNESAAITLFLAPSTYLLNPGFPADLFTGGDFWAANTGAASAVPGDQVYANPANGAPISGNQSVASFTGLIGVTAATGTVAGTVLTLSGVTGLVSVGDVFTDGSVSTTIVSFGTGTGGAGTYNVSVTQAWAAAALTSTSSVLDVTAVATPPVSVGDPVTGTNVPAGTVIAAQLTGAAGGIGTYRLNQVAGPTASASDTVGPIATPFYAQSPCATGELFVMSSWGN